MDFDSRLDSIHTFLQTKGPRSLIVLAVAFMALLRLIPYSNYFTPSGIFFRGPDSWYQYRTTMYTVENWPARIPTDPWSGYPHGASTGAFGTLYDQTLATIALGLGLGDPSTTLVKIILLAAPLLLAFAAVPLAYYLGYHIGDADRWTAAGAVAILAVLPGQFLARSTIGFADHHMAELALMTLTVTLIYDLIRTIPDTQATESIVSLFTHPSTRKRVIAAGVALSLYLLVWPPGLLLLGMFSIFLTGYVLSTGLVADRTTPAVLHIFGAVHLVSLVTITPFLSTYSSIAVTSSSLTHPLVLFTITSACLGVLGLAQVVQTYNVSPTLTRSGVIATGLASFAALYVFVPHHWNLITHHVLRTFGLGIATWNTPIAEAQPMISPRTGVTYAQTEYGLLFGFGLAGLLLLGLRTYSLRRDEDMFLFAWMTLVLLAAISQVRYSYYLSIPMAVLTAFAIVSFFQGLDIAADMPSLDKTQAFAVIITMFVVGTAAATGLIIVTADSSSYSEYKETFDWLATETPEEGQLHGADSEFPYYGPFSDTQSDYPEGTYGVVTWWDYGHVITVDSQRIPVTNPFQHNVEPVAKYYLETDEQAADAQLDALDENATFQYTLIDNRLLNPASHPLLNTVGKDASAFRQPVYVADEDGDYIPTTAYRTDEYYSNMMYRLYYAHGSAVNTTPIVVTYEEPSSNADIPDGAYTASSTSITTFGSLSEARAYAADTDSATVGGVGAHPTENISALKHHRLVHVSDVTLSDTDDRQLQNEETATGLTTQELYPGSLNRLKIFERVPGAHISGTAPPNATINASVELALPHSDTTFTYTQYTTTSADGSFTLTVPYATTDYGELTPEDGYTNTNVIATDPYTITATADNGTSTSATTHVPEELVVKEEVSSITVTVDGDD